MAPRATSGMTLVRSAERFVQTDPQGLTGCGPASLRTSTGLRALRTDVSYLL